MKTNILWENRKVAGVFHGRTESEFWDILPQKLNPYRSNLSLELTNQPKSPQEEFTDSDGGVYGVRFFNFMPSQFGGFLVSPTSRFIWESHEAEARDFKNSGAVRGHVGFHAAWPCSLQAWRDTSVDHSTTEVKALVKGYGDLVLGDMGWRSERLTIISVVTNRPDIVDKIRGRYKWVEVIPVGTITNPMDGNNHLASIEWTVEFQERLDRLPDPRGHAVYRRPRIKVDVSGF